MDYDTIRDNTSPKLIIEELRLILKCLVYVKLFIKILNIHQRGRRSRPLAISGYTYKM